MEWSRSLKVMLLVMLCMFSFEMNAAFAKQQKVIPMGHSIGIQMELSGIFVTNDMLIGTDTWLRTGDVIEQINKTAVQEMKKLEELILAGKQLKHHQLVVRRQADTFHVETDYDALTRLIPFLKDRTEGTGTLTYVDPQLGTYGALGHQIIDSTLKSPPVFKHGAIFLAEIGQIKKSVPGVPGYKISSIVNPNELLGTIQRNEVYGIFGEWNHSVNKVLTEPLEIMPPTELKEGAAEILTTVKGTTVESFTIEIQTIDKEQFHFLLTDRVLLEATGGILQGMSGSPILQNGKFVGAVTHMFVDEPTKGAGLFLSVMKNGEQ